MEREPCRVTINGEPFDLEIGNCAVTMFREQGRGVFDYLTVKRIGQAALRCFGATDEVRWMAGYAITHEPDGEIERRAMLFVPDGEEEGYSFRSLYGWNPVVFEREAPSEKEQELFFEHIQNTLDDEWGQYGSDES